MVFHWCAKGYCRCHSNRVRDLIDTFLFALKNCCTHVEHFLRICTDLYRSEQILTDIPGFVENLPYKNGQQITIMYSKFQALTETTPANHVPESSQQQHFINTITNPDGGNMYSFIRQNLVNMTNKPLKVEIPLLECSNEMDKIRCETSTDYSSNTKFTVMGNSSPD